MLFVADQRMSIQVEGKERILGGILHLDNLCLDDRIEACAGKGKNPAAGRDSSLGSTGFNIYDVQRARQADGCAQEDAGPPDPTRRRINTRRDRTEWMRGCGGKRTAHGQEGAP
jgi:hypothetical protein